MYNMQLSSISFDIIVHDFMPTFANLVHVVFCSKTKMPCVQSILEVFNVPSCVIRKILKHHFRRWNK